MAKFIELNKGWKIFGTITLCVLGVIGLFFAIVGIVGATNGLGFVSTLEQIGIALHFISKATEGVVTNPENAEVVVRLLI